MRVFAQIVYDKRWSDDRAALLLAPALTEKLDYAVLIDSLVKEGYVVCIFDYCGNFNDNVNKTSFPQEFAYAAYPECRNHMYSVTSDARSTPWFQWAKITRRAISMLQEHRLVASDRIGVMGWGTGAQLAWQIAGTDGRVRALVAINGGGYLWRKNTPRFISDNIPSTDEERTFSTGVGAETYAKTVMCPTCLIASSNSESYDIDRAGDILNLVPCACKQLIISRGIDFQITKRAFNSLLLWLRNNFALDGVLPAKPQISFEQIEKRLFIKLSTEQKAKDTAVFVSYGEPYPSSRFWKRLKDGQKTGEFEFTFAVPVNNLNELAVAYATVTYETENMVSTPIIYTVPQKLGVEYTQENEFVSSHLIYNGSMGLGSFAVSTKDVFLDEDVLRQEAGPFDIKGITVKDGSLTLFRSSHEITALDRSSLFVFDAASETARQLNVSMYTYPDLKCYRAAVKLGGGVFWQKTQLSTSDFKSSDGKTLQKFSDTKKCVFEDMQGVILNNLLWI